MANLKYPTRKPKIDHPCVQADMADGGVSEPEVAEGLQAELKYTPKISENIGDDGKGGHK